MEILCQFGISGTDMPLLQFVNTDNLFRDTNEVPVMFCYSESDFIQLFENTTALWFLCFLLLSLENESEKVLKIGE